MAGREGAGLASRGIIHLNTGSRVIYGATKSTRDEETWSIDNVIVCLRVLLVLSYFQFIKIYK